MNIKLILLTAATAFGTPLRNTSRSGAQPLECDPGGKAHLFRKKSRFSLSGEAASEYSAVGRPTWHGL